MVICCRWRVSGTGCAAQQAGCGPASEQDPIPDGQTHHHPRHNISRGWHLPAAYANLSCYVSPNGSAAVPRPSVLSWTCQAGLDAYTVGQRQFWYCCQCGDAGRTDLQARCMSGYTLQMSSSACADGAAIYLEVIVIAQELLPGIHVLSGWLPPQASDRCSRV